MNGKSMQKRIREFNELQLEERESLPNLLGIIQLAQLGDNETVDMYFYGWKEIERHSYDGQSQPYEVTKIRFWDKPLDIWLGHIKRRYTKASAIGEMSGYDGRKITYKVNVSRFEESEIDLEWYQWFYGFCKKIKLEKFEKDSEAKTLNAVRKYIRMGFENHLKKVNNEKIGLERVRVDGKLYYVKNIQEDVFYNDIFVGKDDEGENINFLDIVGTVDTTGFSLGDIDFTSKDYIADNLDEVLTGKQLEKWNMLVEYVNEHGIEPLIDKYTGKLKKASVQRVIYPDKNYKNTERTDSIIKIMNQRMEKALSQAGVKYISMDEETAKENEDKHSLNSEVTTYTGGFTQEEVDAYFERHIEGIFRASVEGRLTWTKGRFSMLPSLDSMLELPFDVYETFRNGGKQTKIDIIRQYYNPEKFKMKAGEKKNIKVLPAVKQEEKNDKYIDPTKLKEIRRKSSLNE